MHEFLTGKVMSPDSWLDRDQLPERQQVTSLAEMARDLLSLSGSGLDRGGAGPIILRSMMIMAFSLLIAAISSFEFVYTFLSTCTSVDIRKWYDENYRVALLH